MSALFHYVLSCRLYAVLSLAPCPNCRQLAAAAHSLSGLAVAAARALEQPGAPRPWIPGQVEAGCLVLEALAMLARGMPHISPQTAFKLGAACSLVLGPGRTVINICLETRAAGQLLPAARILLPGCCSAELAAVLSIAAEVLLPERQPQAAAAFASSTAKPSALLSWLATLTEALPLVAGLTTTFVSTSPGDVRLPCQAGCA